MLSAETAPHRGQLILEINRITKPRLPQGAGVCNCGMRMVNGFVDEDPSSYTRLIACIRLKNIR
jgi:hypothetical protein